MNFDISEKNFASKAKLLASTGQRANNLAHALAVFALRTASETGDFRKVESVINAMKDGHLRAAGMSVWVEEYSPIRFNKEGKAYKAKVGSQGYREYDVETAEANPFWTLDKADEKTTKELSIAVLMKLINKTLSRADAVDDNGEITDKEGNVTYQVKGDVTELKAWASRARAVLTSTTDVTTASRTAEQVLQAVAA